MKQCSPSRMLDLGSKFFIPGPLPHSRLSPTSPYRKSPCPLFPDPPSEYPWEIFQRPWTVRPSCFFFSPLLGKPIGRSLRSSPTTSLLRRKGGLSPGGPSMDGMSFSYLPIGSFCSSDPTHSKALSLISPPKYLAKTRSFLITPGDSPFFRDPNPFLFFDVPVLK